MLYCLKLTNYIFINELEINFEDGFTVFTGETGAGKSIIIDAVEIVLGDKIDNSCIQKDKDYCEITGCFQIEDVDLVKRFELGSNDIIIRRRIEKNGRNKSYINDKIVSLQMLKELGRYIVDIHGQYSHQLLLDPKEQINIVDKFGNVADYLERVKKFYNERIKVETSIKEIREKKEEIKEKQDLYIFQKDEIERVNPKEGEDEELEKEFILLSNGDKINRICSEITDLQDNTSDSISKMSENLTELSKYDDKYNALSQDADQCNIIISEIISQVKNFEDSLDFDVRRLDDVSNRISILEMLKKKYKKSLNEIVEYKREITRELEALEGDDYNDDKYLKELKEIQKSLKKSADDLTKRRKSSAKELGSLIKNELFDLGMSKVDIDIQVKVIKDKNGKSIVTESGQDNIIFLIRTNVGSDLRPLEDIVSGGELSRIMLAIKSAIAKYDSVPLLIFDEIDTGLGGRSAFIVGKKLEKVARDHQVVCITHVPQVAVFGKNHKYVYKEVIDNKNTVTNIEDIKNNDQRLKELGRMLGGNKITDVTITHAKELMDLAKKEIVETHCVRLNG